jgi:hypothetical protein
LLEGQQPEYRIKHLSEDFERVALENELTTGTLNMAKDDDPHAPYKVYEVTQPAPRPGERNSDSNDAAPLRRSVKNETPKMAAGDSGPK